MTFALWFISIKCATSSHSAARSIRAAGWLALAVRVALFVTILDTPSHGLAQNFNFSGYQSEQNVVTSSSLSNPQQIAVDASGNVYIADSGNNRILKESPNGGSYSETVIPSSTLSNPQGVAVDSLGNIYIADTNNGRVLEETLSGGGYVESTVVPYAVHRRPANLAVDANLNVFIADNGLNELFKETPSGGSFVESTISWGYTGMGILQSVAVDSNGDVFISNSGSIPVLEAVASSGSYTVVVQDTTVLRPLRSPSGMGVDSLGDVFIADSGNSRLIEDIPFKSPAHSYSMPLTVDIKLSAPTGVAIDPAGNAYVADSGNNRVIKETLHTGSFGAVNVGTASSVNSLIFDFDTYATDVTASPTALTQGMTGLDFADAGTGSCTTNGPSFTYSMGETCTLDIFFAPTAVGTRMGAGELQDNLGNVMAFGYLQGTGLAPQAAFLPGTQNLLSVSNASNPYAIAVDGVGNLYIANAVSANSSGNSVVKETWYGGGYTQSTVATGLSYPVGVAVDGAGNVYVADQDASAILKASPSPSGYTVTTILPSMGSVEAVAVDGGGNLFIASNTYGVLKETLLTFGGYGQSSVISSVFPTGVAVDSAGNVYLADSSNSRILKEAPSNGTYNLSTVASGLDGPHGVAVDQFGNVYVANTAGGNILKETLTGGTYSQSTLSTGLNDPLGVALDQSGNVFACSDAGNSVWEVDYADAPILHFAATSVGSTSSDSPQTVTLENVGNATLEFPIPASGANPSIPAGFTVNDSVASACPQTDSGSPTPGILASGAACELSISYSPQTAGQTSGWLVLTDNFLYRPAPNYGTQSIALVAAGIPLTPTITWMNPAEITYGTPLSAIQLNATAPIPGTFSYSPAAGSVLSAGTHTVSVTFVPTDTTDFATSTASVTLVVKQATPIVQWSTPAAITYGTALSAAQLDATANTTGAFSYSPGAGSVPRAGSDTLTVTFTPNDSSDYTTVTASVTLVVNQARSTLTWTTPAAIPYGTALSATQLDATASVPGTFSYSPSAGTILGVGFTLLTTTFTPTDSTDYATATASVLLTVNQATPTLTWSTPPEITYGTALSATQLDAAASVPGTFSYSPGVGTLLTAGSNVLSVVFIPTDLTDYAVTSAQVTLVVNQATPAIRWATPASIPYGTALSSTQLNASASIPGSFTYSPAVGTVLGVGSQTLSVTFTPSDTRDYTVATQNVTLAVIQANPTINWTTPASIAYGTALSAAQLNATSQVAGSFTYSQTAGTVLSAGAHIITATFTPSDTTDYASATATVTLVVNQASPSISWATPTAITYGTPLGAAQLDATSPIPGSFIYSPAAGTVLNAGPQTLSATFMPTDATDYKTATSSVSLQVSQIAPTIAWLAPSSIAFGTPLGAGQLDATSPVSGTFTYSPPAGTLLSVGSHVLSVSFVPTDTTDYTGAVASISLAVTQAVPAISWPTPVAITYGTALSSAQLDASSQIAGTFSYSPSVGTILGAGIHQITVTFTPADSTDYATATATASLTVNKASAVAALTTSMNPAFVSAGVTFTATVTSAVGTPTGSVVFYDGTTQLGSGTLNGSTASFQVSSLAAGSHSITAAYSGDANFASVESSVLGEIVEDFTFAPPSGGASSATVTPGGQAVYTFVVSPPAGDMTAGTVNFSVSGLPPGATTTFSPTSIPADSGSTTVTMTVSVPSQQANEPMQKLKNEGDGPMALGLVLLPLLARMGKRKRSRVSAFCSLAVCAVVGTAMTIAISGCGGSPSKGPQPETYTLTITATAGSLSHSTTVSLTVE